MMQRLKNGFIERLYNLLEKRRLKEEYLKTQRIKFDKVGSNFSIGKDFRISGAENIEIGDNFHAQARIRIEAVNEFNGATFTPKIKIGNNVTFNSDIQIQCIDKIEIGDNCLFASHIFISDHDHGSVNAETFQTPPNKRPLVSKGPIILEENVWVGQGAAILSGVTVGKNSIIATNAVVTKDVPPNSVAAGIPARVIKTV